MDNNIILVYTEYGSIYVMKNDTIGLEILNEGYHENNIVKMLSMYTDGGMVIDIGSNIGSTSLALLAMDKSCRVRSFEPQLYLTKMQKDTMRVNDYLDRIRIYNNAVGHKCIKDITLSSTFNHIDSLEGRDSEIKYDDNHVRNYGGINIGQGGEVVDMISIDSMFYDVTEKVSLIKIDVEGAESLAIYGARETIKKHKPVIFYEDNWKKITQEMSSVLGLTNENIVFDIGSFLKDIGYKQCKKVDDNWLWIY
jgi:FkbM family methyltransferase